MQNRQWNGRQDSLFRLLLVHLSTPSWTHHSYSFDVVLWAFWKSQNADVFWEFFVIIVFAGFNEVQFWRRLCVGLSDGGNNRSSWIFFLHGFVTLLLLLVTLFVYVGYRSLLVSSLCYCARAFCKYYVKPNRADQKWHNKPVRINCSLLIAFYTWIIGGDDSAIETGFFFWSFYSRIIVWKDRKQTAGSVKTEEHGLQLPDFGRWIVVVNDNIRHLHQMMAVRWKSWCVPCAIRYRKCLVPSAANQQTQPCEANRSKWESHFWIWACVMEYQPLIILIKHKLANNLVFSDSSLYHFFCSASSREVPMAQIPPASLLQRTFLSFVLPMKVPRKLPRRISDRLICPMAPLEKRKKIIRKRHFNLSDHFA